jgi:pyruvate/2-oxoglutarate dehydrogenase complex dihydrolipoamide dehydrogenase (E3) component
MRGGRPALGIRVRDVEADFPAVMDRARGLVAQSNGELDGSFANQANPRLVTAHGRLNGKENGRLSVRAGDTLIRAERVVLDTRNALRSPADPRAGSGGGHQR